MSQILIVDDDDGLRRALGDRLRFWGHAIDDAADLAAARAAVARRDYDLVLLGLHLPDGSGLDFLSALRGGDSDTPVVMLTAHGSIEAAVAAVRAGAADFLQKPADFDLLRLVVDRALATRRQARARRALSGGAPQLIAESPAMLALLALATQAARSKSTLLITGESGCGKQKLAEYIHEHSDRASAGFVYVNCVAMTDDLIEDTLFGHEKGAFTGALARKEGRLEAADGGTAFLDEIGDISSRMQTRLLHFLETGEFERVGGTRTLRIDCRIIAATNRDLPGLVREGKFREDLYFRLNVIGLHLPPLRERREEIAAMARAFAAASALELGRGGAARIAPRTMEVLAGYDWPGNIRQLKNAIERMVVLAPGDELTPDLLPPELLRRDPGPAGGTADLRAAVDAFKRGHVARVLREAGGNRTKAAERLGLQRTHLSVLLKKYGLGGRDDGD